MKIRINRRRAQNGNALAVALIITAVIGLTLYSYLQLLQDQNLSVVRSQAWNASLTMAEAGVEEALAQLNPGANAMSINLSGNGWGSPSNGLYGPLTRTLPTGTYAVSYTTNNPPIVYSAGSMTVPSVSATLTRVVRVTTANVPLFNVAFGAVGAVSEVGSGVSADSFDSSNTNLSTNGQYDSSKTSTNGNVGSVDGPVSFGNHSIAGNLYLGPTAQFTSSSNQVEGTVYNDFNVDYPDVVLPSVTWFLAPSLPTIIGGVTYNHVFLSTGNYLVTDSGSIYVSPGVTATIEATASTFNASAIHIAGGQTNSGSLIVYATGTSASLGGNSTVDSGVAGNFIFYGMPSLTTISFSGTSAFVGCIYAPEASLSLSGGGGSVNFIGSSITKTISMNGHYNFHFDQALLKNGPNRGYIPASWTEL